MGVKEDDVMGMIENINDDKYFEKIKPSSKEKKRKQQGTESSQDDASNKKRSTFKDRKVSSGTMEWYAKMCQKVDSEIEAEELPGDKNSESISVEPVAVVKEKTCDKTPVEKDKTSKTPSLPNQKKTKLPQGKKDPPKGGVGLGLFSGNKNPFAHRRGDSDQEEETDEPENSALSDSLHSNSKLRPISTFDNIAIQPDVEESGVSLEDQPSSEHVISSVLKDRPKIPRKRKLPSKVTHKGGSDSGSGSKIPNGVVGVHEEQRQDEDRQEKERKEKELQEKERLEKQRREKERQEKEQKEKERIERERLEREKKEQEQKQAEKIAKEKQEKERMEKERIENEKREKEQREKEEKEREMIAKEKQEKERQEKHRLEMQRQEQERIEKEKKEKLRQEVERLEKERQEIERQEKERLENEERERKRKEKEQKERERERKEK